MIPSGAPGHVQRRCRILSLKLLRYLEEVARAGSIRKAATQLNISSSAINRQILTLEEELGTRLFERLPNRMRLTATGELLVAYTQTVTKEHERVLARIKALKGAYRGEIRIATMAGPIGGPLLALIDDVLLANQGLFVRIHVRPTSDAVLNAVLTGEVDIGLGYNLLPTPALRVLQSVDVEVAVVVAPDHPLTRQAPLRLVHCLAHPIATGTAGMPIRAMIELAFGAVDLPFQPAVQTESVEIMKQLAAGGRCITFLSPLDASAEVSRGTLVCLPVAGKQLPTPALKLVVRARGALEPAAGRLAEELKTGLSHLKSLAP